MTSSCASIGAAHAELANKHCQRAAYHQLDFWLGAWAVYDKAGRLQGRNEVMSEYGVFHEHWTSLDHGTIDQTGASLSMYDFRTRKWHHSWFDSFGNALRLDGNSPRRGTMIMTGLRSTRDDKVALERTSWRAEADGSIDQLWDYSPDDGRTWATRFEGIYRKS